MSKPTNILMWFVAVSLIGCNDPITKTDTGATNGNDGETSIADEDSDYLCDCVDDPDARMDDDDEDKGLDPLEDRMVRPANRITSDDAGRLSRLSDLMAQQVFFGNLHSHTKYSDGSGFPEDAFDHARDEAGLDFLAVTEHNHRQANRHPEFGIALHSDRYEGPRSNALIPVANTMTEDNRFIALYGQEFSSISRGNHLCIFEIPHVISTNSVGNGEFDKLLNDWLPSNLDSNNELALVQLNHPWNGNSPNSIEYGKDDFSTFEEWRTELDKCAQLIEVINGPSHSSGTGLEPSTINSGEWRRYLNLGFHLAPTANQDNHKRTWGTITDARTGVIATQLTKADLLEGLRKRHVYASLDKNLRVVVQVEGELCGGVVSDTIMGGQELSIEISIEDDDEPVQNYWVEVFADKQIDGESDDERAKEIASFGPLTTSDDEDELNVWELTGLEYDGWDYIYFRIQEGESDAETDKQAWIAPIWFNP